MSTHNTEPMVKKPREIEIITCHCGSIVAGTVLPLSPEWGDDWNSNKADYIRRGYTVSVVENAKLSECRCKDVIAELEADRAELIRQRQWISVEDALPEPEDPVMWCKAPVEEPYSVHSMLDEDFNHDYFTHWISLPEPPQHR